MRNDHPTVRAFQSRGRTGNIDTMLDRTWLEQTARECGADDAGVVRLERSEMDPERPYILKAFPEARSLLGIVVRMASAPIRSTARSAANQEFHATTDDVNHIARKIVARLRERGIAAMNTAAGFPMEMSELPGRAWIVSHKLVAEAAGLGKMGIHRNVIHPIFGNFILINTILIAADVDDESKPLDYNPCLECKLCVAACPVGAIAADGHFDGVACLNHNYRDFFGGFSDWVDTVADSPNRHAYREKVTDHETASMWQSLSFGANYKSAYCMAACPAGEDVIGQFLTDKAGFVRDVVKPLQDKIEPVYVVAGTDAEAHVAKRFPHKTIRRIGSGVRPATVERFVEILPRGFQRGRSKGITARYHFRFTGSSRLDATVTIANQKLTVEPGHIGKSDVSITVDSRAWLEFLNKKRNIATMLLSRAMRVKGNPRLLADFGRCFPT